MALTTKGVLPKLALLRDASYGMPLDVTFQIVAPRLAEESELNERASHSTGGDEEKIILGSVKGHKVILSIFSPVMKSMFLSSPPGHQEVITIEDTNLKAFDAMIECIYQSDIDWSEFSVEEIFHVVNLAEKYEIAELMTELARVAGNFAVTENNVLHVASSAIAFEHFSEVSSALFQNCVRFMRKFKQTSADLLEFTRKMADLDDATIVFRLVSMASELSSTGCENCGMAQASDCLNGVKVKSESVRFGLRVRYYDGQSSVHCRGAQTIVNFTKKYDISGTQIVWIQDELHVKAVEVKVFHNDNSTNYLCYKCK